MPAPVEPVVTGLVLAAGAGTRAGGPKALRRDADGVPWIERAVRVLELGGCDTATVVLGAAAVEARPLVPSAARIAVASEWADGLAASLRAGLDALEDAPPRVVAVAVTLVDLPGLPADAVRRLLAGRVDAATLRRAEYGGLPGHPVLLGRAHWAAVAASARGDAGAGAYLRAHAATGIECGDLWSGADVDR